MTTSTSKLLPGGIVLALAAALGFQTPAQSAGTLALKMESGGNVLVVFDGSGLDSNPTAGAVVYTGAFDVFTNVVATAVSKPILGDASTASLAFSIVSTSGPAGGTLVASATDTGFTGPSVPGSATVQSFVGGTTSGQTMSQTYVDPGNAAFGTSAGACTTGAQGPFSGAFDNSALVGCPLSGQFSVTVVQTTVLGPDTVQSMGADVKVLVPPGAIGCRFTGGGVDTDGNWNHVLESGEMVRNGAGRLPAGIDRYTFGGQVGARTASQPQPSGEWQHHQQTGPSGSFSFHGGTSSAAPGTRIVDVRCSDPGFCNPARKAPVKQLDFDGIGTFSNVGKGSNAPVFDLPSPNVIPEARRGVFTFHWFEVNIDDLGEPGSFNSGAPNSAICPGRGFGEKSAGAFSGPGGPVLPASPLANCDCPDFYRITVYKGVLSTDVAYLPDGRIDPTSLNRTNVIYQGFGYIDGGNLQIHPPTGYDK